LSGRGDESCTLVARCNHAGARSWARVSEASLRVTALYRGELDPDRDVCDRERPSRDPQAI